MPTLPNGVFSFTIPTDDLARGLRPTKRAPRNSKFLVNCEGAVGYDGVLQVIDDLNLNLIDITPITDDFPYPQIFVFTNVIVVCDELNIYELVAGSLVLGLTASAAGIPWTGVEYYDYIYMSNGKVAVRRRATDLAWEETSELPIASGICDYNGQIFIGAPDVEWT